MTDTKIENLGLSTMIYNALKNAGITDLAQLENMYDEPLSGEDCVMLARELAGPSWDEYDRTGELDAADTFAGNRCRIHIFKQQGIPSVALRLLSENIPDLAGLSVVSTHRRNYLICWPARISAGKCRRRVRAESA